MIFVCVAYTVGDFMIFDGLAAAYVRWAAPIADKWIPLRGCAFNRSEKKVLPKTTVVD